MRDPIDPARPGGAPTTVTGAGRVRIRLIGTPGDVDLALHRLRDLFTTVTADQIAPLRSVPGQIRLYAEAVL